MTPEAEPKKDASSPAPAPASAETKPAVPAPRYRYFTVPPATVRLPVDDLIALLPRGAWIGAEADRRRELALPTAEILEKNFPRIRFSRLSDLLPGCIHAVADAPEWVVLPTDRIAAAYQPETRREPLVEPEKPAAAPASKDTPAKAAEAATPAKPMPAWKRLLKPLLAPPPAPAKSESTAPAASSEAEAKPTEAASPAPARVEPAAPVPEPPPAASPKPISLAEIRVSPEAESRLQQALMTDEPLTVARLVSLGGALPSLQGLILMRAAEIVRSDESLASIDATTLAAGAREILSGLGATSGLRFGPAVTLYAESGPVSVLQHESLRLVVVHRERGFLPGVREKLETILEAIAAAR